MRKYITLYVIIILVGCDMKPKLNKETAATIIETSYTFKKCKSAIGNVYSLGLNSVELEAYEYKTEGSPFPRAIIVNGRLKEIIGVSMSETNKNEATVLFKVQYDKTPLYALKGHKRFDEPSSCSLWNEEEVQVVMIKYDTGWRIKK